MEAYYRVDRAYNAGIVGVERLMVRGNKMEALDRLEILLREVNEKNRRAMAELLMIKLRLIVALRAPPEDVYDLFMQRLQLQSPLSRPTDIGGFPNFVTIDSGFFFKSSPWRPRWSVFGPIEARSTRPSPQGSPLVSFLPRWPVS
jgi:hypothetical protein